MSKIIKITSLFCLTCSAFIAFDYISAIPNDYESYGWVIFGFLVLILFSILIQRIIIKKINSKEICGASALLFVFAIAIKTTIPSQEIYEFPPCFEPVANLSGDVIQTQSKVKIAGYIKLKELVYIALTWDAFKNPCFVFKGDGERKKRIFLVEYESNPNDKNDKIPCRKKLMTRSGIIESDSSEERLLLENLKEILDTFQNNDWRKSKIEKLIECIQNRNMPPVGEDFWFKNRPINGWRSYKALIEEQP